MTPKVREFVTNRGTRHPLPLFLPVYQPKERVFQLALWQGEPAIEGLIVNAYFLYKQRGLRKILGVERTLAEHVGYDGLLTTDSGAFQGFRGKLYLANKDIVRFQDRIGSDVIAPLDLVTPPGDKRTTAKRKLEVTQKRIAEALDIVEKGIAVGVQQGGRFLDLRHDSVSALADMGIRYMAIGSLVPFFNANNNLKFVGQVIRDARQVAGPDMPMHIYGAGDPCQIPFMVSLGADIFDSSSYAHFARGGYFMTPYGAIDNPDRVRSGEFTCDCPICSEAGSIEAVFADQSTLSHHNLWMICNVVLKVRKLLSTSGEFEKYLDEVLARHMDWFPESELLSSWEELHE